MTPEETAAVLAKCAAVDQRTVGRADVLAWHEILERFEMPDCHEAVKRWYSTHRERIMPSDVVALVKEIRSERIGKQPHEVREIPSRFEIDDIRDERVAVNIARIAAAWAMPPMEPMDDIQAVAIQRSRQERGKRKHPMPRVRLHRDPGAQGIDPAKLPGAAWINPNVREQSAIEELHRVGRPCGRPGCRQCRDWSPE